MCCVLCIFFFFFKQKTAYEMRISDWSSDVCSSDLPDPAGLVRSAGRHGCLLRAGPDPAGGAAPSAYPGAPEFYRGGRHHPAGPGTAIQPYAGCGTGTAATAGPAYGRSEEHTSELQSLMRISYAVFCLKKKKNKNNNLL